MAEHPNSSNFYETVHQEEDLQQTESVPNSVTVDEVYLHLKNGFSICGGGWVGGGGGGVRSSITNCLCTAEGNSTTQFVRQLQRSCALFACSIML